MHDSKFYEIRVKCYQEGPTEAVAMLFTLIHHSGSLASGVFCGAIPG